MIIYFKRGAGMEKYMLKNGNAIEYYSVKDIKENKKKIYAYLKFLCVEILNIGGEIDQIKFQDTIKMQEKVFCKNGQRIAVLYNEKNKACAMCLFELKTSMQSVLPNFIEINELAVTKGERKKGYATALLNHIEQKFKDDYSYVILQSVNTWDAKQLYYNNQFLCFGDLNLGCSTMVRPLNERNYQLAQIMYEIHKEIVDNNITDVYKFVEDMVNYKMYDNLYQYNLTAGRIKSLISTTKEMPVLLKIMQDNLNNKNTGVEKYILNFTNASKSPNESVNNNCKEIMEWVCKLDLDAKAHKEIKNKTTEEERWLNKAKKTLMMENNCKTN